MTLEQPEPQVYFDSCWWCDELQYNRSAAVLYCHYHEEVYEDYEICDKYKYEDDRGSEWRG